MTSKTQTNLSQTAIRISNQDRNILKEQSLFNKTSIRRKDTKIYTCATRPIFDAPQLITCSSCNLKKRFAFSGSPPAANASWIARKNGDDRNIPWGTVLRTSSHSPAMSLSEVGTDGAKLFKDSILDLCDEQWSQNVFIMMSFFLLWIEGAITVELTLRLPCGLRNRTPRLDCTPVLCLVQRRVEGFVTSETQQFELYPMKLKRQMLA